MAEISETGEFRSSDDNRNGEKIPLSLKAYDLIMNMILTGQLRMGQSITEDMLKNHLGMSKTPIREAIISLENDGIISKMGRFYNVVYLTKDQINEIYEFKVELEALAAYYATMRMSASMKRNLKQINDKITKMSTDDADPITLANLSGKLHALIAKGSGNSYIEKEINMLRLRLRIVRITIFTSAGRRTEEKEEHEVITQAILRNDPLKAAEAMRKHQIGVWEYVRNEIVPKLYY